MGSTLVDHIDILRGQEAKAKTSGGEQEQSPEEGETQSSAPTEDDSGDESNAREYLQDAVQDGNVESNVQNGNARAIHPSHNGVQILSDHGHM